MVRLSVEERIQAAKCSWEIGLKDAAKKYGISERTIKRYRADVANLQAYEDKERQRRTTKEPSIKEQSLIGYVEHLRQRQVAVNGSVLAAQMMPQEPSSADFYKTRKWVYRTLKKHRYVSRSKTNIGQKLPDDYSSIHAQFILDYDEIIAAHQPELVINMDETPVLFDNTYRRTFEKKGKKTILVSGSKNQKKSFTCVLSVTQDGKKLPPFVIFKGSRNGRIVRQLGRMENISGKCVCTCNNSHWMTISEMHMWIKEILLPFVKDRRFLLIMDRFSVHLEASVLNSLHNIPGCRTLFIPAGLTSVAQPLDISVNRSVKENLRLAHNIRQTLGNMEASREEIIKDLLNVWDFLSEDIIVNGFHKAGLK